MENIDSEIERLGLHPIDKIVTNSDGHKVAIYIRAFHNRGDQVLIDLDTEGLMPEDDLIELYGEDA